MWMARSHEVVGFSRVVAAPRTAYRGGSNQIEIILVVGKYTLIKKINNNNNWQCDIDLLGTGQGVRPH